MPPSSTYQQNESFIKQDTALESMRASDFDCYSAYSEVIDNSIQANASKISIIFEKKGDRNKDTQKIGRMIFMDNGDGMDIDTLHKCLKLGHSSRYNDRNGIGRFGVGMTLGAIHECRKIEVYSKTEDKDWHYTYMDLDEISSGKLEYLPYPIEKKPSITYKDFIEKSGTIVIWTKYDKQIGSFDNILKESKIYFGRVFRKFIWGIAKGYEEVTILVNGESVKAIDPLYVNKSKTGFEEEAIATLLEPQNIKWPITKKGQMSNQKSNVRIDISLLPEEYRSRQGAGGSAHAKERFIDRNEGISILRNDREVFYGHIPYGKSRSTFQDEKNRFIGCEINFNAELDDWFSVKNIKRGAVPIRDLKDKIIELIRPTLRTKQSEISDFWKQQEEERIEDKENESKKNGVSTKHSETNAGINDLDPNIFPPTPVEIESDIKEIINIFIPNSDEERKKRFKTFFEKSKLVVDDKPAHGNNFMSMLHSNGSSTLIYNSNSIFFKVYEEIQSKGSVSSSDFKVFIDLILIAFLFAEKKINPEEELDGKDFCEDIKENWASQLTKLFRAWYSKK